MCNREAPDVAQVARRYDGEMVVLGIARRDTAEAAQAFVVRHHREQVPQALDSDDQVWARMGISGQPAWVFIDGGTGRSSRHFGALSVQQLDQLLDRLAS